MYFLKIAPNFFTISFCLKLFQYIILYTIVIDQSWIIRNFKNTLFNKERAEKYINAKKISSSYQNMLSRNIAISLNGLRFQQYEEE